MMNSKSRLSPSPIDTPTPSLHSHHGRILHVCDVSADWYGDVMMGVEDMRFKESSDGSQYFDAISLALLSLNI